MYPKVSVIVPLWGVEKYIEKCARCLFEQTLDEIEFIFVDDCSPDRSVEVLENVLQLYPKRKEQCIIIRLEENKGASLARKIGFDASHGSFIAFCDSDDWTDKELYAKLYNKAVTENNDFVFCDFVFLSDEYHLWEPTYVKYTTHEERRNGLLSCKISNALWNKLISRELFMHNFYFPLVSLDEDDAMVTQWSFYAKSIGYMNECLYYHYLNPESITHEINEDKRKKRIAERQENRRWIVTFLESKNQKILDEAIYMNKRVVKLSYLELAITKDNYRRMLNEYSEINHTMMFSKNGKLKERVFYSMLLLSYPTCKLAIWLKTRLKPIER